MSAMGQFETAILCKICDQAKKYFILSKCLLFRSIPFKPDTRICIMRSQARVVNLFCLIIKLVSRPFEAMQAAEGLA